MSYPHDNNYNPYDNGGQQQDQQHGQQHGQQNQPPHQPYPEDDHMANAPYQPPQHDTGYVQSQPYPTGNSFANTIPEPDHTAYTGVDTSYGAAQIPEPNHTGYSGVDTSYGATQIPEPNHTGYPGVDTSYGGAQIPEPNHTAYTGDTSYGGAQIPEPAYNAHPGVHFTPTPEPPVEVHNSQPPLAQPEPHLAPQVTSPFQDQNDYDRRSSLYSLQPQQTNPFDSHSPSFLAQDDPYNADYEEDSVPLTNYPAGGSGGYSRPVAQSSGTAPYPLDDDVNPMPKKKTGLLRGLTTRVRNTGHINPGTPYYDSDVQSSVTEMPLEYGPGLPQVDGLASYNQPQNAYFPTGMPYDNPQMSHFLAMPEPDRPNSVNTEIIDYSWQMRQQLPVNENYAKRQINLINGVFKTEYQVPSRIKACVEPKYMDLEGGSTEFSHMRYTAATVDPDEFDEDHGYVLRAKEYNRETELLIAVTYYSEDKVLTARTLSGIMKNISHFCSEKQSKFWSVGPPPWQRIVVTIIMDGIDPCRKDTLDCLATMGIYQDGVMKKAINDKATVAHIFEYSSQVCISPDLELMTPLEGSKNTIPPIQYILCLKQENSKKINSHRWLFNAFSRQLNPNICVLIDAGTKPASKSIVHLWRAFYNNENIGGACGEIHAMLGKGAKLALTNPLVAAQNFEYKISNILDKPLESTFGFISVLPGAFSAYRYRALLGRPLEQYFLGDHSLADRLGDKGLHGMNIFTRNMFLAEDRILCFEITFKKNEKWHLQYVKASKAETDVPEEIDEFISQRRRWLNGSFAATLYSMMHFAQIYRTDHNLFRTLMFHIQLFYNFVNIFLTWLSLAAFYLTVTVIMSLAARQHGTKGSDDYVKSFPFQALDGKVSEWIALVLRFIYLVLLLSSFILALGNRPKGSRFQYKTLFIAFGIIQTYSFVIAIYLATQAFSGTDYFSTSGKTGAASLLASPGFLVILALASTFGLYIVSALLYLDVLHLLTSLPQYMFIMPSFTNVVNVYAFCNWHDVSWGTKGADKPDALPAANSKTNEDGTAEVVEEVERPQTDIDMQFDLVMQRALKPYPKEVKSKNKPDTDDQNKSFRTNLVIFWAVCNAILATALTTKSINESYDSDTDYRTRYYFLFLIIVTAIMAFIRFIGCFIFVSKSYIARGFGKK